jgi:AcrR family transcriptional regulator
MTLQAIDTAPAGEKKNAAQRVFEAAQALFYEKGIRAVGVDEIVARAGVTKPSLYRAFASKDALVAACLQDAADRDRRQMEATIAKAGPDPAAQLIAVVRYEVAKMEGGHFRGCAVSNAASELSEADHPGRIVANACKTELRGRMKEIATALPAADPGTLADGLLMLVEGAFSLHHACGCPGLSARLEKNAELLIEAHRAR